MTDPNSKPWQSFSLGKWLCKLCLYLLLIVFAFEFCVRGTETEREEVLIGEQLVKVTTKASFRRGLALDHSGVSIGREYYSYKVTLDFPGGQAICFRTKADPEAIWRLNGQLYFVGREGVSYVTARLESDGTLTRISKDDLPTGPRPWNFGQLTKEQQQGTEYFYQRNAR